jgi:hypothetical protein
MLAVVVSAKLSARARVIQEANDKGFVDDYYSQLRNVFAKQHLVPTYGMGRVSALIRHLQPTGNLLLRAIDAEGHGIATGIVPAMHDRAYFWRRRAGEPINTCGRTSCCFGMPFSTGRVAPSTLLTWVELETTRDNARR